MTSDLPTVASRSPGRMKVAVALVFAALWSVGLIVAAVVAPFYQSSSGSSSTSFSSSTVTGPSVDQAPVTTTTSATLVEVNGPRALVLVGIPLFATGAVALALRRRARTRRGAGPFAWTVAALLSAFTLVAMLSIGIFIAPVTGLLIVACTLSYGPTVPVHHP